MRVTIMSIPVRDQEKAFQFYTKKLGFLKKVDMPLEGGNRWLTLVSPEAQDGPELLLEPAPIHFEPCKVFQDALMQAGIPWTGFEVDDVQGEYDRLTELGVEFSVKPTAMGTVKIAVLNDTCGNNIQLMEIL
ncbi:VOC family protein [Aureisphaera galaxeae]|uniref:VOC family protein n=1 Tax=Aureisphaera galaxeae TaxID=1538023 RepID=UPI002350B8C8|nr:VOC family protein [Aureisphaera galaxeae]MDC8003884.1 VOC family protein [Aureisphaera galaxeae]